MIANVIWYNLVHHIDGFRDRKNGRVAAARPQREGDIIALGDVRGDAVQEQP
jgi:hypothetical protein